VLVEAAEYRVRRGVPVEAHDLPLVVERKGVAALARCRSRGGVIESSELAVREQETVGHVVGVAVIAGDQPAGVDADGEGALDTVSRRPGIGSSILWKT
jgi:hypothetical protein